MWIVIAAGQGGMVAYGPFDSGLSAQTWAISHGPETDLTLSVHPVAPIDVKVMKRFRESASGPTWGCPIGTCEKPSEPFYFFHCLVCHDHVKTSDGEAHSCR